MQIGSRIQCIENAVTEIGVVASLCGFKLPELGETYICDGAFMCEGDICVYLQGLKQYNPFTGQEFSYPAKWFIEVKND